MVTPRQERTGVEGPAATGGNVAEPGPMPDLAPMMRQATNAGLSRMSDAKSLIVSPQGSGVDGHHGIGGGDNYQWDAGLAVNDVEGGGSG